MTKLQRFLWGIGSSYIYIGASTIYGIIIVPIYLHYLSGEEYGLWLTMRQISGYFGLPLGLFSFWTVINRVAEGRKLEDYRYINNTVSTFFWGFYGVVASLIVLTILAGNIFPLGHLFKVSEAFRPRVKLILLLTITSMCLQLPWMVFPKILVGLGEIYREKLYAIGFTVISPVIVYAFLSFGGKLEGLVILICVYSIFRNAVLSWDVKRRYPISLHTRYFQRSTLWDLCPPSLYFFLLDISELFILGTDNVVISSVLAVSLVPLYAIPFQLMRMIHSVVFTISYNLLPQIPGLKAAKQFMKLQQLHVLSCKSSLGLAMLFCLGLVFFGRTFINLWVGESNTADIFTIYVLISLLLIWSWTNASSIFLRGLSEHRRWAYLSLVEGALNLGLSLAMAPYLGIAGVALGTLISHAITSAWFVPWYTCRVLGSSLLGLLKGGVLPWLYPLLVASLPALCIYLTISNPWLRVIFGLLVTAAVYLSFGYRWALDKKEKIRVLEIFGRLMSG